MMDQVASPGRAAHQRSQSAYIPPPHQFALHHTPSFDISNRPLDAMAVGNFSKNNPGALGELQQNQQEAAPRSPRKTKDEIAAHERGRSQSPIKSSRFPLPSDIKSKAKSRDNSPIKQKKSGGGLAGLLSRPKSLRNLYKLSTEEVQQVKDKENKEPQSAGPPPPIYAQFASDQSWQQRVPDRSSVEAIRSPEMAPPLTRPGFKERPKSFQVPMMSNNSSATSLSPSKTSLEQQSRKNSSEKATSKSQRGRMMNALGNFTHKKTKSEAPSPVTTPVEQSLDLKDIDKHLEAMLDRRNIPENQRYKMRNLNDTIKMEFIRQDWAEMQAAKAERPGTNDSFKSVDDMAVGSDAEDDKDKPKRTRGRSFTFSRGKKENSSTKKSKGEGTLGRHFRSRSTDSVASERPTSSGGSSSTNGILSKIKLQQGPAEYVGYLRKVQKPELVEVGKLHKLRLLLRNETVAWIEDFIQQGGMREIVGLLERIMAVEWREEHEDALLHENLLCLKALSTTARGMQYLDTIQGTLFPKLLGMLFDPERKGPSEFTTRNIITSILFAYIQSAPISDRTTRAQRVLTYLRDPEPKDDERPLPWLMEMRQERPYRVWSKEIVSVTKEVFWIFLHNLNVVALPSDKGYTANATGGALDTNNTQTDYMVQNFPNERPPVPAAPYVGGVEWDATNYLASHLDLLNAILACTPSQDQRNRLRGEFRISGIERCMGGSLRLCKEKFYGSVHDGLRTWVAAAAVDEWPIKDVRYGPPPEARSPKKMGGGAQKKVENAPKIEIPKLDLGLDKGQPARDAWL